MNYKDQQNKLHFIEPEFAHLLPSGCVPITDNEAASLVQQSTPEQITAAVQAAVQAHLDALAVSWNYISILSAASYAASTVPQFQAEALALIAWRDAVWVDCYTKQAAIQAGTQPIPASPAAFVATLPAAPARPVL
jgi:hypothetical protein